MILTVGNLKGGVGKTTLACNISVALAARGRDVLLIDAERTALDFTTLRASKRDCGYTAVGLQGRAIRDQMKTLAKKYDEIVVDVGGEDATGSLRAALTVADVVLVPVKPRSFELWRTEETMALINLARELNESLRAVAVLNEADYQGRDNEEALAELQALEGLDVAPGLIYRRKAWPNAAAEGLGVTEYRADPKAGQELDGLMGELWQ
jgi:chromosome partitioning protein